VQLLEVQYELADLPFIVRCGSCTILCVSMKKAIAIRLERSYWHCRGGSLLPTTFRDPQRVLDLIRKRDLFTRC